MSRKKPLKKQKKHHNRQAEQPNRRSREDKLSLNDSLDTIFGFHPVYEALKNTARKHHKLYATKNAEAKLSESLPAPLPIEAHVVSADELSKLLGSEMVHQGLVLQSANLEDHHLHDLKNENIIVLLDQITDPHNIGAIMRSACAFGAQYIVMTDRNTPSDNMTTSKSASGAREYIRTVRVTNLSRSIEEIKKMGFVVIGLDSEAEYDLASPDAQKMYKNAPTALVMGAEGKGLRRLTREKCDLMARINANGPIVSLNVSNATALALYELTRDK